MTLYLTTYKDKRTGERRPLATWHYEFPYAGRIWRGSTHTSDKAQALAFVRVRQAEIQRSLDSGDHAPGERRQVIIGGEVFLYHQKAPFVVSGCSVKGALEWDEATDSVKCHECGEWHRSVAQHSAKVHGISAREYKMRHGLTCRAALVGEGVRDALVRRTNPIPYWLRPGNECAKPMKPARRVNVPTMYWTARNRKGTCPAQLLEKVRTLSAQLGRPVRHSDLDAAGINSDSLRALFGQGIPEIESLARLMGVCPKGGRPRFTREVLIESLRDFWVRFGRTPSQSDWNRGFLLATKTTYQQRFGTIRNAYYAAGIEAAAIPKTGRPLGYRPQAWA